MNREEFYFDSRDGISRIHAVRYTPEQGEITCVIQFVHGMAEYFERYESFARFMTDRGIVVTGSDHLGHGKSLGEDGVPGYFCRQDPATVVVRDVHRLKKITQELYPGIPYVILGNSMGSFILRNYMCRYGSGISGAIIMGTGMPPMTVIRVGKIIAGLERLFFGDRHASRVLDRLCFQRYIRKIPHPATEMDWLSRNAENVELYIKDPMCGCIFTVNGFRTVFELLARTHKKEELKKIPKDMPILMMSGAEDPVGDYSKGVRRTFDSMKEAGVVDITLKLYGKDRHEILNETDRNAVMQDIYDWLKDAVIVSNLEQAILDELRKATTHPDDSQTEEEPEPTETTDVRK
jgi:alpha-beta hydrolase superfamily lysophospholipase